MKKILLFLSLAAIVGFSVFYFIVNKPHKDVADEDAIPISAAQLFVEYTANEKIANDKYLNKALAVSGTISLIEENQDKQQYIVLKTDDDFNGIMCTLRENNSQIKIDENVVVKGYCSGFVGDVKLTDCLISKN